MQTRKIFILGDHYSGKTQFIQSLSEIEVVSTEIHESANPIGFDFGRLTLDSTLYFFGNPGARGVRSVLAWINEFGVEMFGYIGMVNSYEGFERAKAEIQLILSTNKPCVIAANFQDHPTALPPHDIRTRLEIPADVPVLPCIATDKKSVCRVLLALFELMIDDETSEKVCNKLKQMLEGNTLTSDFCENEGMG